MVHVNAPALEYWPTGHAMHTEAPGDDEKLPEVQLVHVDAPENDEYWPKGHAMH